MPDLNTVYVSWIDREGLKALMDADLDRPRQCLFCGEQDETLLMNCPPDHVACLACFMAGKDAAAYRAERDEAARL